MPIFISCPITRARRQPNAAAMKVNVLLEMDVQKQCEPAGSAPRARDLTAHTGNSFQQSELQAAPEGESSIKLMETPLMDICSLLFPLPYLSAPLLFLISPLSLPFFTYTVPRNQCFQPLQCHIQFCALAFSL